MRSTGQTYRGNVRSGPSQYRDERGAPSQFKIPQGSLVPDRAPLETRKFFQPLLDVLAIAGAIFLGLSVGGSVLVFFIMLFLMRF